MLIRLVLQPDYSAATFRLAGLVDAYAAACRTVASILQGSPAAAQQQQQQQQRQYGAAQVNAAQHTDTAIWLVSTWDALDDCWPVYNGTSSPLSASACMSAAPPAFVSLAVAVLQDPAAGIDHKGLVIERAISLCNCLRLEALHAIAVGGAANQHQTLFSSTEAGRQMMQSKELPMLLATCSAACAQHAYACADGKAGAFPAAKNAAAAAAAADAAEAAIVPKYHSNLLKALQVTGDVKFPGSCKNSHVLDFMNSSCTSLQTVMTFTAHSTWQVGSSSTAAAVLAARTAAAALPLSLIEPWLLGLAEVCLLVRPKHKAAVLTAAGAMLQAVQSVAASGGYGLAGKLPWIPARAA
jgi:hypothetical protein